VPLFFLRVSFVSKRLRKGTYYGSSQISRILIATINSQARNIPVGILLFGKKRLQSIMRAFIANTLVEMVSRLSRREFTQYKEIYAHEIVYDYDSRRRNITASYRNIDSFKNGSLYHKIVYHYNRQKQLTSKTLYPRNSAEKEMTFHYNRIGRLTSVVDSYFIHSLISERFRLNYDTIESPAVVNEHKKDVLEYCFKRNFDSVNITSADTIMIKFRDHTYKLKTMLSGQRFLYSNFRDGDEKGWSPPAHTDHRYPHYQFSGTYRILVYEWAPSGMLNAFYQANYSSYQDKFFLNAEQDVKTGAWNISVYNEGLYLDGGWKDVTNKAQYLNKATAPIVEFKYDKVQYTYQYEYY
jgi:hypothetical protein